MAKKKSTKKKSAETIKQYKARINSSAGGLYKKKKRK